MAAAVLSLLAGPAHAGCSAGPGNGDARIRKGSGNYKGVGVYGCDGDLQDVGKSLLPGERYTADVRVKNDGNGPTDIRMDVELFGSSDEGDFKIKFLKPNGKDVTERVLSDLFEYQDVAEGASTPRLRVVLKATGAAVGGDSLGVSVAGFLGDNSPISGDVVNADASVPT